MEEYFDLLLTTPLFAGVQAEELPGLLVCLQGRTAAYTKDQPVLLAGDPPTRAGLVLTGAVQVIREDYDGRRSILGVQGPGQLFAEVFTCAQTPALPVSVLAASDCRVLLLDLSRAADQCANHCAHHSRLTRNLLQILAQKNLHLQQKLELTGQRTTREKLLAYLRQEAARQGTTSFAIPFDRQQLADYLGVDRSAMSTELGKLRREGLVDFQRNRFTLPGPGI